MTTYLGDFALGSTFDHKFTTVSTTGVPASVVGTPVVDTVVNLWSNVEPSAKSPRYVVMRLSCFVYRIAASPSLRRLS